MTTLIPDPLSGLCFTITSMAQTSVPFSLAQPHSSSRLLRLLILLPHFRNIQAYTARKLPVSYSSRSCIFIFAGPKRSANQERYIGVLEQLWNTY